MKFTGGGENSGMTVVEEDIRPRQTDIQTAKFPATGTAAKSNWGVLHGVGSCESVPPVSYATVQTPLFPSLGYR